MQILNLMSKIRCGARISQKNVVKMNNTAGDFLMTCSPKSQWIRSLHGSHKFLVNLRMSSDVCFVSKRNFSIASFSSRGKDSQLDHKQKKSDFKRLLKLAEPEKKTLASAIGFLVVSSTITMSVPFALGHVIDVIYSDDATTMIENLNQLCLGLTAVFITGGLANFIRVYLMSTAGQRITRNLRSQVFSSIISQEAAFFDKNKTGELVNRLSADTALVSQSLTMNISDGLRSFVMITSGVGMMFYMSTKLAMVGLTIVPPVAVLTVLYGRYIRNLTRNVQDKLAEATQVADERISNIRTVKSFAQETKELSKYNESIDQVLQMTYRESLAKGVFFGMTGLSGNLIVLSVLYSGGVMLSDAQISVGNLSSFLLYAAYVGASIGGASSFFSEMNRGIGAATRLFDLIDRVPKIPVSGGATMPLSEVKGDLRFENVSFQYPSRVDQNVLENMSLSVPSGSVVALVGASGSGKSTVGLLLQRLYDPDSGLIYLDDKPIQSLNPLWLRSLIGSVSQEPVLFSTTILENLLYGLKDGNVPLEKVKWAAQQANALTFIEEFPQGFHTVVGERGTLLSGGQKQRIAIARALLTDPKILLLDEATSALDGTSEGLVQEALERLMHNRTVITIAHRLSTIRNADKIAVLQNGRVAEIGSYYELMQDSKGIFRKLVQKQTISS